MFEVDWPNDKSWDQRGERDVAKVRYCVLATEALRVLQIKER